MTESLGLLGFVAILMLALRYQSIHGGRSILPSFFKPSRYDYFVKFNPETVVLSTTIQNQTTELEEHKKEPSGAQQDHACPICLENLFSETSEQLLDGLKASPFFRTLANRRQEYMKAPCGHRFHAVCLINWMYFKLECPSCRQQLPPL